MKEKVVSKAEVIQKQEVIEKKIVKKDGATIFLKCVSCHGKSAEKKALNKSQVIKGWKSNKLVSALQGYKNGTYGSSMKGVMKPQVSKLSDAEIEAVSNYISNL